MGLYQPLLLEVLLFTTFGPFMIVTGILEVAAAGLLWNKFVGTRWMAALGLVAFFLGLLITVQPLTGFDAVEDLIGLAQILRGVICIATALTLREKLYDLPSNDVTDL